MQIFGQTQSDSDFFHSAKIHHFDTESKRHYNSVIMLPTNQPAKCHPEKPVHGNGLCMNCYKRMRVILILKAQEEKQENTEPPIKILSMNVNGIFHRKG